MKIEEKARLAALVGEAPGSIATDDTTCKKPYCPQYEDNPDDLECRREFYRLRYEFFKRSPEPSGDCLDKDNCGHSELTCNNCHDWSGWEVRGAHYKHLAENPDEDTSVEANNPINIREFQIRVNIRSTAKQIDEELRRQMKVIKAQLHEEKTQRRHGLFPQWTRRDELPKWRRCLEVFDRKQSGESWESIGLALYGSYRNRSKHSMGKTGIKPKGTLTRDARDDFNEANRLIASALNGTFPE